MMENDSFGVPVDMASQSSILVSGISHLTIPNSLVNSNPLDLNDHNHIEVGLPLLTLQGEPIHDPGCQNRPNNHFKLIDSNPMVTSFGNTEFQDQIDRGRHNYAVSIDSVLASSCGLQGNPKELAFSDTQLFYPLETFRACATNGCSQPSGSSFETYKFPGTLQLGWEPPTINGFQPNESIGSLDPNQWISSNNTSVMTDNPYGSSKLWNELSLSLATSQSTGTDIPDQCSEMSFPGVTHNCLNETGLGSDQVILGSKYLSVLQDILSEIASYSLENLDQMGYSTSTVGGGTSQFCPSELITQSEAQTQPSLHRRAVDFKKNQLLNLLQLVDDQYNQCMDEIHTVISAFHAVTELDPQLHIHFSLQMISFVYKNLRERITNQILAMGLHLNTMENERSFENSFIQKQWALQQLKRKDHQLWRPQRGLPERSVSVLRSWMFQNFLHPYPKDTEKHLLAVKSGLTRSQVSNWFINARVRLWKPMIEEMYAEMNRRKTSRNQEGNESNQRNQVNISRERFSMN